MILFADRNKKMKLKSDVRFISTKFANVEIKQLLFLSYINSLASITWGLCNALSGLCPVNVFAIYVFTEVLFGLTDF